MSDSPKTTARLTLTPLDERALPASVNMNPLDWAMGYQPTTSTTRQLGAVTSPVQVVSNPGQGYWTVNFRWNNGSEGEQEGYFNTRAAALEAANRIRARGTSAGIPVTRVWIEGSDANAKPTRTHWYGNYLGPGNAGYHTTPVNSLDAAARTHDMAYDRAGVGGIWGALFNPSVAGADRALSNAAWNSFQTDRTLSPQERNLARLTSDVFGTIATGKETWNTLAGGVRSGYDAVTGGFNRAIDDLYNSLSNALAPLHSPDVLNTSWY